MASSDVSKVLSPTVPPVCVVAPPVVIPACEPRMVVGHSLWRPATGSLRANYNCILLALCATLVAVVFTLLGVIIGNSQARRDSMPGDVIVKKRGSPVAPKRTQVDGEAPQQVPIGSPSEQVVDPASDDEALASEDHDGAPSQAANGLPERHGELIEGHDTAERKVDGIAESKQGRRKAKPNGRFTDGSLEQSAVAAPQLGAQGRSNGTSQICFQCRGSGMLDFDALISGGAMSNPVRCPTCSGNGSFVLPVDQRTDWQF